MKTKSTLIVGGGTSGLITGLILKTAFPDMAVDIIESSKLGIVGVGEGSTEHWDSFCRFCNISKKELIDETDATFKYGINFINWNGDGENFFHAVNGEYNQTAENKIHYMYLHLISNGANPNELLGSYIPKSMLRENNYGINQFHFDTFKLNQFLHKKCNQLGIKVFDEDVQSLSFDDQGFITKVNVESGNSYEYDLYVDSTGFAKFMLHKSMNIKWNSYQKYLPMNSAIAFPTGRTENIDAWTIARSMTTGWLWRIPTQERHGNGYVFNDNFIDFDGAKEEVEQLYGHEVQVGKKIKFDAGCLEKFWHKNCVAIGLSAGFVEPLEASSIGTSIQQAFLLVDKLPLYVQGSNIAEDHYNKNTTDIFNNILDFISLHYRVKRKDTEFWKSMNDVPMSPGLEKLMEIYKYKTPTDNDFDNNRVLFKAANWIMVMHGLGLIDPTVAAKDLLYHPELPRMTLHLRLPDFSDLKFISHREAINNLKGKSKND